MGSITIVGLGPGRSGQMTVEVLETLKQAQTVILRTKVHPTVAFLEQQGIKFISCDNFYEKEKRFEQVYLDICTYVLKAAENANVVYAVPGSPLVAEKTVVLLREHCRQANCPLTILPAMSFLDLIYTSIGIDPIEGVRVIDAKDERALKDAGQYPLVITQVYSQLVASELKITLMEYFDDATEIVFGRNLGLPEEELRTIPLYELDRQKHIDHLTTIYIPRLVGTGTLNLHPLVELVKVLREPGGCPWDQEQNHKTLRRELVEEVYELLEAIDDQDIKGLREELGDVLLQVAFHARLAEEDGYFAMQDIIDDVVGKMIHRHPHVFGTITVNSSAEVLQNWEILKAEEKTERKSALDGVAKGLPALMRAYKLQSKAAKVGFDWSELAPVWAKVEEEVGELREAISRQNTIDMESELGDLLFALVNYGRHLGLEPETALNGTNNRFSRRFQFVEAAVRENKRTWQDYSLDELDKLWQEAKKSEKIRK